MLTTECVTEISHAKVATCLKKKNLVWHSHNFLLPQVEEYFINSITFIFNLYFIFFIVDELPAFIIIA